MADWTKILSRGRVEDRRGLAGAAGGAGALGLGLALLIGYLNTGSIDLGYLVNGLTQLTPPSAEEADRFAGEDEYEVFASSVIGSANEHWAAEFSRTGRAYEEPTLVLFRRATASSCGGAESAIGPHYCPLDETIYLDETFFEELRRLGADGDVAQAYVLAHEVGHHVQEELGLLDSSTNEESVRVELQADCLAGAWAHSLRDLGIFEPGEIREAMDAAAAVGDDRLQKAATGRVNPESFTHGSSAERVDAFTRGYSAGTLQACGA